MSVQFVIEVSSSDVAQRIVQAIDAYKAQLRASIERTARRLAEFETKYGTTTAHFLAEMTAEDLPGHDLEYVEWAGEARLLERLQAELRDLEDAHFKFS